jgi:tetratricopeptide (TPR) repeat protein
MSGQVFRLLIASLILTFTSAPAVLAQLGGPTSPGQIHGQVRYAVGGAPAFQILVRLERFDGGLVDQQLTDRNGRFRFSSLRRLTYNVFINTAGFLPVEQQVELLTKNNDYLILTLKADNSGSSSSTTGPAVILDAKVPVEARKEFERGRIALLGKERQQEGITHLEKAILIYPKFLEAHLMLGTAYMDAHQLDKAEAALRKALKINPALPEAYFALGEIYRQQRKYAEAEKVLREGLKNGNHFWQGHYTLGRVYWEMHDIVKAGPQIGLAIQLKPDLAEAHLLAGNILLRAHKPDDALLEFQEYLRLAPKGAFSGEAQELIRKIKRALAEKQP